MKNKSPKYISQKPVAKQSLKKGTKSALIITTNLDKALQEKLATSFGKLLAETFTGTYMP